MKSTNPVRTMAVHQAKTATKRVAATVKDYLDPTSNDPSKIAVTHVCYLPVGGQTSAVIGPSKTGVIGSKPCGGDGYPEDPGPGRFTIESSSAGSRPTDSSSVATAAGATTRPCRCLTTMRLALRTYASVSTERTNRACGLA